MGKCFHAWRRRSRYWHHGGKYRPGRTGFLKLLNTAMMQMIEMDCLGSWALFFLGRNNFCILVINGYYEFHDQGAPRVCLSRKKRIILDTHFIAALWLRAAKPTHVSPGRD